MKETFACCGNRKGQLTAKLNEQVKIVVERCSQSPEVASAVMAEVLTRSRQVKTGITALKGSGSKNFDKFGQTELATFTSATAVEVYDLTSVNPISTAMTTDQLDKHRGHYTFHRDNTETLKSHATTRIQETVNAQ
jgi:hypothetical protein